MPAYYLKPKCHKLIAYITVTATGDTLYGHCPGVGLCRIGLLNSNRGSVGTVKDQGKTFFRRSRLRGRNGVVEVVGISSRANAECVIGNPFLTNCD